jgi:hypothetical protein
MVPSNVRFRGQSGHPRLPADCWAYATNGHAAAAMCFPRRQLLLLMTLADLGQLLKRYHPPGDLLDLLPWDIGVLVDVDGLLE